jgi:UDP-glucose 4-epimerase
MREGRAGETYIPRVPSARVTDLAEVLIGDRPVEIKVTGIRPGEKVHEILVSEEEGNRTTARGDYYVIGPMLPELRASEPEGETLGREYSSGDDLMDKNQLSELLRRHKLMVEDRLVFEEELLA